MDSPPLSLSSILLIAFGFSTTWLVIVYAFTKTSSYEKERSQMNRTRQRLNRFLKESRNQPID